MFKTNVKKYIKKMMLIILLVAIYLIFSTHAAMAVNSENSNLEANDISNYVDDINDEEEVSNAIRNLILTINSEGMNKNLL